MNILDVIFPKRCVGCGRVGKYFCSSCIKKIRRISENEAVCAMCGRSALDGITHPRCRKPYGVDRLTSFFHYEGVIKKAIKTLKYRLVSDLAGELMALVKMPGLTGHDMIVIPIPLHPKRHRQRGFNQAEVLGNYLLLPMKTNVLRRVRATMPQADIKTRKERLENMKQSFVSGKIRGNILLFDDVTTTGATMRSAASALKRAGAGYIWAVTIAR